MHAANAPLSSEHSNVAVESGDENVKLALAAVVEPAAGPVRICVSGAVVSIVQLELAGLPSALPAASIARTANVCAPSPTPSVSGEVHAANGAPSREH